jgi:branched-chain amino acid aminotransferase
MWTCLNGRLVRADEAMVAVSDRGFLYGDSIFDTMAAYSGVVFRLDEHLRRFANGAKALGIPLPHGFDGVPEKITSVLDMNHVRDGLLRMTLTRGSGPRGLSIGACQSPTFVIQCFPCPPARIELRKRGATMAIACTRRIPSECLPSANKTGNYLNSILAFKEAEALGADEALMLNLSSDVVEGTVSNIFFVAHGSLFTPSLKCGAMPGITRAAVLEIADALGIEHWERRLPIDKLSTFSEVFYTNTGVGIMPVSRIGERRYVVPGPVTGRLVDALGSLIGKEAGPAWNAGSAVLAP